MVHSQESVCQNQCFFVSPVSLLINVDILIRNEKRGFFTWCDEKNNGKGWQSPGGIIRLQEDF